VIDKKEAHSGTKTQEQLFSQYRVDRTMEEIEHRIKSRMEIGEYDLSIRRDGYFII